MSDKVVWQWPLCYQALHYRVLCVTIISNIKHSLQYRK